MKRVKFFLNLKLIFLLLKIACQNSDNQPNNNSNNQSNNNIKIFIDWWGDKNLLNKKNKGFESILFERKQSNEIDIILNAEKITHHKQEKKKWTVLVYIAGVNNLFKYAIRNIRQMMQVGSNSELNIIIHFDFHIRGMQKMTKRFYVERDKLKQIGNFHPHDSGDAKNLINAVSWAASNYPSEYFSLILWNHGTGSCDPHFMRKLANPQDLFYYNQNTKKIALDRSKEFLKYIKNDDMEEDGNGKGICFDDTTKNYLDNKKLSFALEKITEVLKKKIDVMLFDACLMGGVEIADLCAPYINFLVSSEEVVLGPGYNYAMMLKPLQKENITPYEFSIQAVKVYAQTYAPISHDFTQSALNLSIMEEFRNEFKYFTELLINYILNDSKNNLKKTIKLSASKEMVTHFSEPSYIDLRHFLDNILFFISQNSMKINLSKKDLDTIKNIKIQINKKLLPLLNKIIIANATGENIKKAHGLYIYFPKYQIEEGYKNTSFPQYTKWLQFLELLFRSQTGK